MFQQYIKNEKLQAVCYGSNYIIFDPLKHKHEPIQMALALTEDLAQRLRYPVAMRLVGKNKEEYLFVSVHIGYISDGQNEKFNRTVDDFGQMIDNLLKSPSQISTGSPTIVVGGDFNRNAVFFAQLLINHENSIFYTTADKKTSFADNDGKYNVENVDLLFVKRHQTKTTAYRPDTLRPIARSTV